MSLFGTLRTPRNLVFGAGQRRALPGYAAALGKRALIVTDQRLGADEEFLRIVEALMQAGVQARVFDGTIAANIAWGSEVVERAAMERALRDASADFVLRLPHGLDTRVGEVGRQLSGGERQRISLARALLRNPSLVILDEVTAALDPANEATIARTIERLRGRCTFVILGHRPALHALADQTIELGHAA